MKGLAALRYCLTESVLSFGWFGNKSPARFISKRATHNTHQHPNTPTPNSTRTNEPTICNHDHSHNHKHAECPAHQLSVVEHNCRNRFVAFASTVWQDRLTCAGIVFALWIYSFWCKNHSYHIYVAECFALPFFSMIALATAVTLDGCVQNLHFALSFCFVFLSVDISAK